MKGKNFVISFVPVAAGTVVAYTVLFAGSGMENN